MSVIAITSHNLNTNTLFDGLSSTHRQMASTCHFNYRDVGFDTHDRIDVEEHGCGHEEVGEDAWGQNMG